MNVEEFLKAAKERDVTVVFKKIGSGEVRKMHCTLNPVLAESFDSHISGKVTSQRPESDHLVVWALDKDAWRSFRVSTVVEWYEGEPK